MKYLKFIAALAAFAASVASTHAQSLAKELRSAQITKVPTSVNSSTTTSLASTNAVFALVPGSGVGLVLKFTGSGAGTSNVTLKFGISQDGTTVSTEDYITWVVAATGTTPVVAFTNIPPTVLNNAPYLAVRSIANANANSITSVSLRAYTAVPPSR